MSSVRQELVWFWSQDIHYAQDGRNSVRKCWNFLLKTACYLWPDGARRVWLREFIWDVKQCGLPLGPTLVDCLGWLKEHLLFLIKGSCQIYCKISKVFLHAACLPQTIMSVSLINTQAFWEWIWFCLEHPHNTWTDLWRMCPLSQRSPHTEGGLVPAHWIWTGNKASWAIFET